MLYITKFLLSILDGSCVVFVIVNAFVVINGIIGRSGETVGGKIGARVKNGQGSNADVVLVLLENSVLEISPGKIGDIVVGVIIVLLVITVLVRSVVVVIRVVTGVVNSIDLDIFVRSVLLSPT